MTSSQYQPGPEASPMTPYRPNGTEERLYWDHGRVYRGGPDGSYLGCVWWDDWRAYFALFPDGREEACCSYAKAVAALEGAP